jgi:hypothetical protein
MHELVKNQLDTKWSALVQFSLKEKKNKEFDSKIVVPKVNFQTIKTKHYEYYRH